MCSVRADERLRPEDLGFGKLFERIRDAVIVADASTQRIVLWNAAAAKMFGYSASEALKMRVEELVPEPLKDAHRAGITRYARTGHGRYIDSDAPLDLPAMRKNGQEIDVELSLSPIRPVHAADYGEAQFVLAIIRDVTGRKRAEGAVRQLNKDLENRVEERTSQLEATIAELESHQQELRHSEEIFRLLVEGVRDYAIFMLGPDGRIVSWNEGAERIQGYEVSEVLGEHFSVFYTEEDVERGLPGEELRIAAIEGRFEEEGWRVRKDGTLFQADVVITALRDEAGDLRGFSQVTRDITAARKEAEEALRSSLRKNGGLEGRSGRIGDGRDHRRAGQDHVRERQVLRDLQVLHGGVGGPGSPHPQLRLPYHGVLREPVENHRQGRRLAGRDQEPGTGRHSLLGGNHHRAFPRRGGQASSILRHLQRHYQVQRGRIGTRIGFLTGLARKLPSLPGDCETSRRTKK